MEENGVESEGELVIDEREEGEIEDEEERGGLIMDIEDEDEDEEEREIDVVNLKEEDGDKERGMGSRMILRPHSETKPSVSSASSLPSEIHLLSPTIPTSSSSSSLMTSGGLQSTSSTSSMSGGGGGPNRMKWEIGDMLLFYEGVKQYGKDFDALHRVMSRRSVGINKEQLRNFFFNFYKQVRSAAEMKEEDWPPELSRDARDLFVVINGCEWRKRMGSYKFEPAKLKALILEGTTVTRVRCKKPHVTIKTPCCPALLQFFSFNRRISRFPPDMALYLSPLTFRDGTNVMSRGQSQHLCIRLNTCDRVERIFDLLYLKWRGDGVDEEEEDEEEEERGGDGREGKRPFTVKLHPSKHTPMGEITFTPSPSSYGNVSINMLQEDRRRSEIIKRQLKRGMELEEVCYTASQSLIPHLTITRSSFINGLTKEAAGSASVAELYAVCGLSREIYLRYSIEETTSEEVEEPWDILAQLINRGYGEAATEKRPPPGLISKMPSRDDPIMSDIDDEAVNQPPLPKRSRPLRTANRPSSGLVYITQSPIVTKEMDDFAEQLRSLSSAPRPKRRSPVRMKTLASSSSFSTPSHPSSRRKTMSLSKATPTRRATPAVSAASTPGRMPPSTPTSMSSSTTFPSMSASGYDPMAMALKAALASPSNSLLDAPSTSSTFQGSSRLAPAMNFPSPSKTNSSLPFDVRSSMEHCMSQESGDYCMQFAQLINCTDISSSPSKIARL